MSELQQAFDAAKGGLFLKLENVRKKIAELQEDREALETLRIPKAEAIKRAHRWVDEQASEFQEHADYKAWIFPELRTKERPSLFEAEINQFISGVRRAAPEYDGSFEGMPNVGLAPVLCWLQGAQVKKKLSSTIEGLDYEEGLPSDHRGPILADVVDHLAQVEWCEERLIMEAAESGWAIPRREECKPEIVLALERPPSRLFPDGLVAEDFHETVLAPSSPDRMAAGDS